MNDTMSPDTVHCLTTAWTTSSTTGNPGKNAIWFG